MPRVARISRGTTSEAAEKVQLAPIPYRPFSAVFLAAQETTMFCPHEVAGFQMPMMLTMPMMLFDDAKAASL